MKRGEHTDRRRTRPLSRAYFAWGLACALLVTACFPAVCAADDSEPEKTLIIYYSRTGKSSVVCDTLKNHFKADTLEIKDLTDRSGTLGFYRAALDSFLNNYTEIEPAAPDLSGYSNIVLISPIWNWNISVPIRTVMAETDFTGKRLVVETTANIDIKKYEPYGDDAPFIKRFFRDYLRKKSLAMRELAKKSGADIRGHFHVATKDVPPEKIQQDTLNFIRRIETAFAPQKRPADKLANGNYQEAVQPTPHS